MYIMFDSGGKKFAAGYSKIVKSNASDKKVNTRFLLTEYDLMFCLVVEKPEEVI